jgi:hypothetical protein
MSAYYFSDENCRGVIHLSDIFRYKGITFEWHRYCGPVLLKKNLEPRKEQPGAKSKPFWDMVAEWQKLSKTEHEKYRIYG